MIVKKIEHTNTSSHYEFKPRNDTLSLLSSPRYETTNYHFIPLVTDQTTLLPFLSPFHHPPKRKHQPDLTRGESPSQTSRPTAPVTADLCHAIQIQYGAYLVQSLDWLD